MPATPMTNTAPVRMTVKELHQAWEWVEACCVSLYGETRGKDEARKVPLRVGLALWKWYAARNVEQDGCAV